MSDPIIVSRQHHLIELTFNRPEKLNAFTRSMCDRLEELCEEIRVDESIRVILLRGSGEAFVAGTDLHELYQNLDTLSEEVISIIRQFNACILMLRDMPKLVISAVHGLVSGVGLSLMLASDLTIASDNAKFAMGFTQMAVSPAGAASYLLPRMVGAKKALELFIMSDIFDAQKANEYGLVNWVVPHDALDAETQRIVDKIANGPMVALGFTKQLIQLSLQNKFSTQMEVESEAFVKCINTKDFKTAVRSLMNKTTPEFEGR